MSHRIDRPGIFKATIDDWKLVVAESGARGVNFTFTILEKLEQVVDANGAQTSEWQDWSAYQFVCYGTWWLVKKDRTLNEEAAEQLALSFGWDGDLDRLAGYPPSDVVQINVKADVYKGVTSFKAAWMNPGDYAGGGGGGGASADDVKATKAEFGAQLRAACGAVLAKARSGGGAAAPVKAPVPAAAPAPASAATAPARAPTTRQRRAAPASAPAPSPASDIPDDEIPF